MQCLLWAVRLLAAPAGVCFLLLLRFCTPGASAAKGAVWLWEEWMALSTAVAGSTAYMVSVGNHEYGACIRLS